MASRRLGVALLGQGFMGRAHSNAWRQVKHFFDVPFDIDTRVICGRNRDNLERMASTWGWAETSDDWRAAIARPDIDVVDVCLPNHMHAEASIAAAAAGKIVLCEKPLAMNLAEAIRMAGAVQHVPNGVWFNYRRIPAIGFTRRLIDEGRIGQVYHYRATYLQEWGTDPARPPSWKTSKAEAGSGVLGDLLSHAVDLSLYLNGPIAAVCGYQKTFAAGRDIDDATIVLAKFVNGSIGTLEATRYATGYKNRNAFEIHGSKGMARFNLEDLNHLEFLDATGPRNLHGIRRILATGPDHPYSSNFWKPGHVIGYEHTFIAALGDFLTALANGDRYHPDFEDALEVQRVLGAIERSAQAGSWMDVAGD